MLRLRRMPSSYVIVARRTLTHHRDGFTNTATNTHILCHTDQSPSTTNTYKHLPINVRQQPIALGVPDVLNWNRESTIATYNNPGIGLVSTILPPTQIENSGIEELPVLECGNVLKKRRRKMNRHKYKKWRKRMRNLFQKLKRNK
eukprot:m.340995 g.340995  ORF g.340995 m.340995 type:complete len:145 (-) comp19700_c0_seq1:145-579(-)